MTGNSSNSFVCWTLGNTVLSISGCEWAQPARNLYDDTEFEFIIIQSGKYQTYCKVFSVAEVHVCDFCFAVLNSLGWDSILTS